MTDELLSEYFIFTITRNPYQRLESAYQYIYKKAPCSFSTFCLQKINTRYNHHYVPQYIICNNKNIFDYIGKMEENYEESVRLLFNKLGIYLSTTIPVTNASKKRKYNYSNNILVVINNIYDDDFKLFNYDKIEIER